MSTDLDDVLSELEDCSDEIESLRQELCEQKKKANELIRAKLEYEKNKIACPWCGRMLVAAGGFHYGSIVFCGRKCAIEYTEDAVKSKAAHVCANCGKIVFGRGVNFKDVLFGVDEKKERVCVSAAAPNMRLEEFEYIDRTLYQHLQQRMQHNYYCSAECVMMCEEANGLQKFYSKIYHYLYAKEHYPIVFSRARDFPSFRNRFSGYYTNKSIISLSKDKITKIDKKFKISEKPPFALRKKTLAFYDDSIFHTCNSGLALMRNGLVVKRGGQTDFYLWGENTQVTVQTSGILFKNRKLMINGECVWKCTTSTSADANLRSFFDSVEGFSHRIREAYSYTSNCGEIFSIRPESMRDYRCPYCAGYGLDPKGEKILGDVIRYAPCMDSKKIFPYPLDIITNIRCGSCGMRFGITEDSEKNRFVIGWGDRYETEHRRYDVILIPQLKYLLAFKSTKVRDLYLYDIVRKWFNFNKNKDAFVYCANLGSLNFVNSLRIHLQYQEDKLCFDPVSSVGVVKAIYLRDFFAIPKARTEGGWSKQKQSSLEYSKEDIEKISNQHQKLCQGMALAKYICFCSGKKVLSQEEKMSKWQAFHDSLLQNRQTVLKLENCELPHSHIVEQE